MATLGLFGLPLSVRKSIYRYALECPAHVAVTYERINARNGKALTTLRHLPLLLVCRNIYKEVEEVIYGETRFDFHPRPFDQPTSDDVFGDTDEQSTNLDALYDELFLQLSAHKWEDKIFHWFKVIGRTNRTHLRNILIDLGTWTLHTHKSQQTYVAKALRAVTTLCADTHTSCTIVLRIGIPTPAPTPCAVTVNLPISKSSRALEIIKTLFGDGVEQLESLLKQQRITPDRFGILSRDLRTCLERLTLFVRDATADEPPVIATASYEFPIPPSHGLEIRRSRYDSVTGDSYKYGANDCTKEPENRVAVNTSKNFSLPTKFTKEIAVGEHVITELSEADHVACEDIDEHSEFSARASSEIRNSFFGSFNEEEEELLDPHLIKCLTTPRSQQHRLFSQQTAPPSPSTHLTASSINGSTILEDWEFAPSSPLSLGPLGLSESPSMSTSVASHIQMRWARRMEYLQKIQDGSPARSGSSDGTRSSMSDRISIKTFTGTMQPFRNSDEYDGVPRSQTRMSANTRAASSPTMSTGRLPLTPRTPRCSPFPLRQSSISPRSVPGSPSASMQARFAKRAIFSKQVLSTPPSVGGSPVPRNTSAQSYTARSIETGGDEACVTSFSANNALGITTESPITELSSKQGEPGSSRASKDLQHSEDACGDNTDNTTALLPKDACTPKQFHLSSVPRKALRAIKSSAVEANEEDVPGSTDSAVQANQTSSEDKNGTKSIKKKWKIFPTPKTTSEQDNSKRTSCDRKRDKAYPISPMYHPVGRTGMM